MPGVSVVIPLYNKGRHIARALDSVLCQTFQDYEVVVVDDGSADGGGDIVGGYLDSRIRLIRQQNQGASVARNRGIRAAEADLVAFLDADDEWLPTFLERVLRLRKSFPDAGLLGTAYEVHFPGSIVPRVHSGEKGDRLIPSYFRAIVDLGTDLFNSSSIASPKDLLLEVGGFPEDAQWNEDGFLRCKLAIDYPVAYTPIVCSVYHKYSSNSSSTLKEYVENPFLSYFSEIPPGTLEAREDFDAIVEYCDLCRLSAVSRNIYSGFGSRARADLRLVGSPRYTVKKQTLLLLSYFPPAVFTIVQAHARTLSLIKQKFFRS